MSTRIALRKATKADLAIIAKWYEEALALAHAERDLEMRFADAKAARCELLSIVLKREDEPVGLLDYRVDDPAKGWLTTVLVLIAGGRRGSGYGSEAVREVEQRYTRRWQLAQVDRRNGLGLYFWLRMGYRPARREEIFWRAPDGGGIIAMVRKP